jgi:hypothetical protein
MREQGDPQDLRREQGDRHAEEWSEQHHRNLGRPARQPEHQEPADVGVDPATFAHGRDQGAQLIVRQNQIGGLAGDLRPAPPHRNADVGAA